MHRAPDVMQGNRNNFTMPQSSAVARVSPKEERHVVLMPSGPWNFGQMPCTRHFFLLLLFFLARISEGPWNFGHMPCTILFFYFFFIFILFLFLARISEKRREQIPCTGRPRFQRCRQKKKKRKKNKKKVWELQSNLHGPAHNAGPCHPLDVTNLGGH